ncbi:MULTISPECIES: hypothetical protein [Corynebacterium]|uniref:hypothetical protein n=1 Tax=Corynebacterium TaxID=1716 RepID=UPI00124C5176|nr:MULTISPECIES: hypothetical protein [Corynebacterium]
MKIRIVRGCWEQCVAPFEYTMHRVGDEVEVSAEDAARLIGGGTAVDAAKKPTAPKARVADPEPEPKPAPKKRALPKKPRRAAAKAEWVKYAEKIGVTAQTAGGDEMEKAQLIAAVEARISELEG